MKISLSKSIAVSSLAMAALLVHAEPQHAGKGMDMSETKKAPAPARDGNASAMADGEVEEVDKENRSITLRHGPIRTRTIEMEPMTMPFAVKDASLLSRVKVGDKVKFRAEYINDVVTITSLRIQK